MKIFAIFSADKINPCPPSLEIALQRGHATGAGQEDEGKNIIFFANQRLGFSATKQLIAPKPTISCFRLCASGMIVDLMPLQQTAVVFARFPFEVATAISDRFLISPSFSVHWLILDATELVAFHAPVEVLMPIGAKTQKCSLVPVLFTHSVSFSSSRQRHLLCSCRPRRMGAPNL